MATEIDSVVDAPELAAIVNKIAAEAKTSDKARSIYFAGVILNREECRLLWEYLQTPRHGFWDYKNQDEEE